MKTPSFVRPEPVEGRSRSWFDKLTANGNLLFLFLGSSLFLIPSAWTGEVDEVQSRVQALIPYLKDSSPEKRLLAAEELGRMGPPAASAVPALGRGLRDSSVEVRQTAAVALGKIGPIAGTDPQVVGNLGGLVENRQERIEIRLSSIQTLGEIRSGSSGAEHLRAVLEDPSASIRRSACSSLGKIDSSSETIQHLARRLADPEASVRDEAVAVLARIGLPAIPSILQVRIDHPAEYVGQAAGSVFKRIGAAAIADLEKILADSRSDPFLRSVCAWALGQVGEPAIPPLVRALQDPSVQVRLRCAEALGAVGSPVAGESAALQGLVALLEKESSPHVREAAAEALGRIGGVAARSALIKALSDPSIEVQQAAGNALSRIN